MASVLLVVGFIGLIDAVALGTNMMNQARRQTLASQIVNHELEKLRLADWSYISGLTPSEASVPVDREFWPAWDRTSNYPVNGVVSHEGSWYRCISANSDQPPPNASYWVVATSAEVTDIVYVFGAVFTLRQTVGSPDSSYPDIREINFSAAWSVTTGRRDSDGNPVSFTYRRSNSGWFGKLGLNLAYQRS